MPQVIALVGSEHEENLSLRYLAGAVERVGFLAELVPFSGSSERAAVIERVLTLDPLVVGISVPFQVRAREMLSVATDLRARGYAGHVCVGGHFATFEYENLLHDFPAIDSIVRHEGEDTFR
jgi:anaerobic magnesium-protoporphyrin IX monomethyl ester cyclase